MSNWRPVKFLATFFLEEGSDVLLWHASGNLSHMSITEQ